MTVMQTERTTSISFLESVMLDEARDENERSVAQLVHASMHQGGEKVCVRQAFGNVLPTIPLGNPDALRAYQVVMNLTALHLDPSLKETGAIGEVEPKPASSVHSTLEADGNMA